MAETWDNGKPIRGNAAADIRGHRPFPLFAGIRAQEGGISEIDEDTIAYHFHESLGVWVDYPVELSVRGCLELAPPSGKHCVEENRSGQHSGAAD